MKFKDYPISQSIKAQLDVMGFNRPTDIQFRAIKHILKGEDVMAVAQTGTGKTAAFVIPVIHHLLNPKDLKKKQIRCLVMVPTRELAKQISEVFKEIGAATKLKTLGLFGGVDQEDQIHQLQHKVDILVTTPGRMFDLVSQGFIDLSKVEILVLDEADLMLDLGFTKEDRAENVRRVAEVGKLMVDAGLVVIVALVSPFKVDRDHAREIFDSGEFIEVWVKTPAEICAQRDPKGLYKKAREGKLPNLTGVGQDYEAPTSAELVLDGTTEIAANVEKLMKEVL